MLILESLLVQANIAVTSDTLVVYQSCILKIIAVIIKQIDELVPFVTDPLSLHFFTSEPFM